MNQEAELTLHGQRQRRTPNERDHPTRQGKRKSVDEVEAALRAGSACWAAQSKLATWLVRQREVAAPLSAIAGNVS